MWIIKPNARSSITDVTSETNLTKETPTTLNKMEVYLTLICSRKVLNNKKTCIFHPDVRYHYTGGYRRFGPFIIASF